jgi:hypothetical protein
MRTESFEKYVSNLKRWDNLQKIRENLKQHHPQYANIQLWQKATRKKSWPVCRTSFWSFLST